MTKAEIIEHYGVEWYERLKERNKLKHREYYKNNRDKELVRLRAYHKKKPEVNKKSARKRNILVTIGLRDRLRALRMGLITDGQEVHHLKYHADKRDETWINDVLILSHEEHVKWHMEHPEFCGLDNVV